MIEKGGSVLRLYVNDGDRYEGVPLYEWIVLRARKEGISGACAFRGVKGFGPDSEVHSFRFFRSTRETPVVVELVDEREKLSAFLRLMHGIIAEGLATESEAEVRIFRWEETGADEP